MYRGYNCFVFHQGKISDRIPVYADIKQGCILLLLLFNLMLDSAMKKALNEQRGISWGYKPVSKI